MLAANTAELASSIAIKAQSFAQGGPPARRWMPESPARPRHSSPIAQAPERGHAEAGTRCQEQDKPRREQIRAVVERQG